MTLLRSRGAFSLFSAAVLLALVAGAGCTDGSDDPTPDAAPPTSAKTCKGVAESCSLLASDSCYAQEGCHVQLGECSGISRSCYDYFDSSGCYGQPGCSWDSFSGYCEGTAESCASQPGQFTCGGVDGCTWQPDSCTGTALTCGEMPDEYLCGTQLGCRWE